MDLVYDGLSRDVLDRSPSNCEASHKLLLSTA